MVKKKVKKRMVAFQLDEIMAKELESYCKAQSQTMSAIIKILLNRYIAECRKGASVL